MKTVILNQTDLPLAVAFLKEGNPVAFPTETVYGLGASVFDASAIGRIFAIKGRPSDNPLIAHAASLEQAESIGREIPSAFYKLAARFWPGPLALIVQRGEMVVPSVSAGLPTIAIRVPSHPIARELIEQFGAPLAAPSANLSGRPSPTTAQHVIDDLDGRVAAIIDGGASEVGIESTVVSLVHEIPTILRPGAITKEMLEASLGGPVVYGSADGPVLSPGMKYRHYAPKARLRLVFKKEDLCGPYFLATSKNLYALLRSADRENREAIDIYCDESVQSNAALMNRLLRAAGQL